MVDIRDFIAHLKHSRGDFAGQQFVLQPWQSEYFDKLLNTKNPDGLRQYRRSLLALPRKSGKTQMAAALALYMGFFDDIGAEVIVAAGDRSQASLLHTAAKHLLESCPAFSKRAKVYRNSIVIPETNSTIICISSEAGTKHGYNPSCVLIDEYHVFKDRELVDVLETGMGARSQPLVVYITTAGTDMLGPCYKEWQRAEKIRDGVIEDKTFLPCIYAAPKDADPFDIQTAIDCNPNFGVTTKPEYFEQMIARARESMADEIVYRTLHLNQFVQSENKFFRSGQWEANSGEPLPGGERPCFCGLDLSSNQDTTAFTAVWPGLDEDGGHDGTYDVHSMVFIPEDIADRKEKQDRVPYREWARQGFVILTEGDITDYDKVRDYVLEFCEANSVQGVAVDRWNANHIISQLTAEGVVCKPYGQGYASMSSPSKFLHQLVASSRLRHGGNPCLAWQASNVTAKSDEAENIKFVKPNRHSTGRIDAVIALVMALGLASAENIGGNDELELVVI